MTNPPVGPDTMRRLAFIRLLLSRAKEDAQLAAPFGSDSVNRLHDVVEMFLALAAQERGVSIPNNFMDYWVEFQKLLGRPLGYQAQMQKFNKLRVNLKHYGTQPHTSDIEAAVAAVQGLLADECPDLFGIDLDDASLSEFIAEGESRRLVDEAETKWAEGDGTEAFACLAEAFERLIRDYGQRKRVWANRSVFETVKDMRFESAFFRGVEDRRQADFEDKVVESLKALDFRVMLIGLGVDLRRYGKFEGLVPTIEWMASGARSVYDREGATRSDADFEFCRDFVVGTAIHLAEFDYEFDHWEEHRASQRRHPDEPSAQGDGESEGLSS